MQISGCYPIPLGVYTLARCLLLISIDNRRCNLTSLYLAGSLREECTPSVVGTSEVTAKSIRQNRIVGGQHLSYVTATKVSKYSATA